MHCDSINSGSSALGQHPSIRRQANGKLIWNRCRYPKQKIDQQRHNPDVEIQKQNNQRVPSERDKILECLSRGGGNRRTGEWLEDANTETTTPTVSQALSITNSASSQQNRQTATKWRCVAQQHQALQDERSRTPNNAEQSPRFQPWPPPPRPTQFSRQSGGAFGQIQHINAVQGGNLDRGHRGQEKDVEKIGRNASGPACQARPSSRTNDLSVSVRKIPAIPTWDPTKSQSATRSGPIRPPKRRIRSNPAKKPMLRRARFDTIRIMTAGSSPSRLPDFLIIGGMKCGSTTLFRDLDTSPAVSFPAHKEPHNLLDSAGEVVPNMPTCTSTPDRTNGWVMPAQLHQAPTNLGVLNARCSKGSNCIIRSQWRELKATTVTCSRVPTPNPPRWKKSWRHFLKSSTTPAMDSNSRLGAMSFHQKISTC